MNQLLSKVKASGQDFEWYPTTRAMLEVVAKDIKTEMATYDGKCQRYSILDIGAGNGNALKTICELTSNDGEKYAIEKSRVLINSLPEDVFVVGTDFHAQTLIDKQVDVVFCNPPYSEFSEWMRRIVAEANCGLVYLVVPQRWKDDGAVVDMLKRRCGDPDDATRSKYPLCFGSWTVLDSTTFEDSEFRQARAKVDIIKIKFKGSGGRNLDIDPFDIWFDSTFSINADKKEPRDYEEAKSQAEKLHDLVIGQNLIERLEELYHADFENLLGVYRSLESFDKELFRELGVSLGQVKEGLKSKIQGLKSLYWKELFSNLGAITDRLTSKSRKALLDKLVKHTSIDYTADNAYAVVIWAIKNANHYFDQQLCEVYLELSEQENVRNYKSNHRIIKDGWRYERKEQTHYTLDYRLVLNRWRCFPTDTWGRYEFPNGLHHLVHDLLGDICTIAKNLGFDVSTNSRSMSWEPGKKNEFYLEDGALFMDVKAFKKGTTHIRINQDFMRKLNIEAGRLNGWVKSASEASEETGIENAAELYGVNFKLKSVPLLGSGK